jgi:lipid-A-disaccharide synthase
MSALKYLLSGNVQFAGIGGPSMEAQGLKSLFPMSDLSVMGLAEIIPHLPRLISRLRDTVTEVARLKPCVVITIDSPGFSLRVTERVRRLGIRTIQYVAPQLWAWHPERGNRLASQVDHLLALLPFEPEFFSQFNVGCTFVGHPIVESGVQLGDGLAFRVRHKIDSNSLVLLAMPGSRKEEVRRLLPVFSKALERLRATYPDLTVIVPTIASTAKIVANATEDWRVRTIVTSEQDQKADVFAASDAAVTKSGTSTLELALAGVPMVVAYKVSALTAFLARRLITVENVAMVNLLMDREIVPECLQEDCNPDKLFDGLASLIGNESTRQRQLMGLSEAVKALGAGTSPPSERAARAVLKFVGVVA